MHATAIATVRFALLLLLLLFLRLLLLAVFID